MVNPRSKDQNCISVISEKFTWANASMVAMIDAKSMATDCDKYCKRNTFQYYTVVNTWLLLIADTMGDRSAYSVRVCICRDGLLPVIGQASDLANQLINYYQSGVSVTVPTGWFMPEIMDMNLGEVLQLLRYPKRFTPTDADILRAKSITGFKLINKRDREWSHKDIPMWMSQRICEKLSEMLRGFPQEYEGTMPKFSNGATTAGRTLYDKIKAYGVVEPYILSPLYPIGQACEPSVYRYHNLQMLPPKVTAVPKSYKTYRIIAPEHPFMAANKQRIKDAMRSSIAKSKYAHMYTPNDQENNRNLAREGSIDGSYATIDLSSASDTVTAMHVAYLFPYEYTSCVWPYWNEYLTIDGEWYRKYMFATSGDPICFDTEAFLFLSIALACQDLCSELTGEEYHSPSVYGDDIIVDIRLFDTMMEWLELLGFIPNSDKSFGSGGYRESCGVEYYYGYDTSTKYWPRRVILNPKHDIESLDSLMALERNLFSHWTIVQFMTDLLTGMFELTSSEPGSDTSDLWADAPWFAKRSAPMKKGTDVDPEWTLREAHSAVKLPKSKDSTRFSLDVDMYYYVRFLHDGPHYECDLDERQGISQPTTHDTDFEIRKPVLTKVVR